MINTFCKFSRLSVVFVIKRLIYIEFMVLEKKGRREKKNWK